MPKDTVKSEVTEEKIGEKKPKVQKKVTTSKKAAVASKKVVIGENPKKTSQNRSKEATLAVSLRSRQGTETGKVNLPKEIFGAKINKTLMAQAVRVYLANQRQGNASTKSRGEVVGSTRKIYRQKGTGRARHGAITAPIFVGGGIVHGPKPHDFSLKMSQTMRKNALFSALSLKHKSNQVLLVEDLDGVNKTKDVATMIMALNLANKKKNADRVLFVLPAATQSYERAIRNIAGLRLERANQLNTYEVLKSKYVLFVAGAIEALKSTFLK